jgi:CRP/FNR family transcriptional regulator
MTRALFPALFCGATAPRELQEFQRLAEPVMLRSDARIFSEHDAAEHLFGLSRGVVRIYKMLPDRRRQVLTFALPGELLSPPPGRHYLFSADAIGEVSLCRFRRDALIEFVQSSPAMMRLMIEFVIRELDQAQHQLLLLGNRSAEEKVTIFLIGWRDRLARMSLPAETVPLPMRRQDIADFLGLKLETVSRTLAKLEHKGVIRLVPKGFLLTGLERATAPEAAIQGAET